MGGAGPLDPLPLARLSRHQERLRDRPFTSQRERAEVLAPLAVRYLWVGLDLDGQPDHIVFRD